MQPSTIKVRFRRIATLIARNGSRARAAKYTTQFQLADL